MPGMATGEFERQALGVGGDAPIAVELAAAQVDEDRAAAHAASRVASAEAAAGLQAADS